MTAHKFPSRRLCIGSITVLAALTLYLGVYSRAGHQVRTLDQELARMQPQNLDNRDAMRNGRSHPAGDAKTDRHRNGIGL